MKPTCKAVEFFEKAGWQPAQLEAAGYIDANGNPTDAILTALRAASWTDDAILDQGLATTDEAPKPDEKVARYVALRDELDVVKKQFKEREKEFKSQMEVIEGELGGVLTQMGQSSMASASGTFFFVDKTQLKVEEYEKFQRFFLNTILNRLTAKGFLAEGKTQYEALDAAMDAVGFNMLTQAVRKDGVLEYEKENGELPPGISKEVFQEVQVRRPTKK